MKVYNMPNMFKTWKDPRQQSSTFDSFNAQKQDTCQIFVYHISLLTLKRLSGFLCFKVNIQFFVRTFVTDRSNCKGK